jgi:hypothetical protein
VRADAFDVVEHDARRASCGGAVSEDCRTGLLMDGNALLREVLSSSA